MKNTIEDAIRQCFISPNVNDRNFESANMVDVLDACSDGIYRVAKAITPPDAAAMETPNGGRVASLTEAVIYAAENIGRIADALSDIADAIRSSKS